MTEQLTLYGFGDSDRSGKVRWIANELGLSIDERRVQLGDNRKAAYKELNPYAHIPTAVFRGERYYESTAICQLLAEAFDEPKLWIGRGQPERASYLQWLAVFGETLEARLVECSVSRAGILGPEYFALHERTLRFKLGVVADQLPSEDYLCGSFSVADILAGYNLRLAIQCELIERARVAPYFDRLVARPAAQQGRVFSGM